MKYFFILFAALFIGLASQLPASASWAHVQDNSAVSTSAGTTSFGLAYSSNITSGNLAVVCIGYYFDTSAISTVTDSQGNTWTKAAGQQSGSDDNQVAIYYSVITTGGADTVTVTFNATEYPAMTVAEYSFTAGTISVSNTNGTNDSNSAPSAGSVTFTAPKALIICSASWNPGPATLSAGTGFTMRSQHDATSGDSVGEGMEDYLNATSSPVACAFSSNNAVSWACVAASFQSSGDSGGGSPAPGGPALLMRLMN